MLSPGMYLALHSAELLTEAWMTCRAYSREMRKLIKAWMVLIEYFYNGRIFSIYHSGMAFERRFPGMITTALHRMCDREIASMASGLRTTRGLATACCNSCRAPPPGKPIPPRWQSGNNTPTSNAQHPMTARMAAIGCSMLTVGC